MPIALSSSGPESGSRLEPNFGRSHWFFVNDIADGTWGTVEKEPPTGGGPADPGLNVQVGLTGRMGSPPGEILSSAGTERKQAENTTVEEALTFCLWDELTDLADSPGTRCQENHAHGAEARKKTGTEGKLPPGKESKKCQ
ncbi:MAG: NifB/NifX family molybdenum-iron cluster-binding protein [Bryobacteraceae bacterium]